MPVIKRNALVPFTSKQMFELVNDIEEYPRFLPWCSESEIINKKDNEIEAKLVITWAGLHKSFTTRNILFPNERIEIKLVNGPFRELQGVWSFAALGQDGCAVDLELDFEFSKGFMDALFQPIFNHIANSLVDAFCKRAVELYENR